ncbi:hypothetical protein [Lutibacter sp.]|uniref:hypothetical protein n=1 Tax=Lutibacter sp. TaxID=1925666 RepID=UPI00349FE9B9
MDPIVSYKAFEINKSYSNVIYDSSIWISGLKYMNKELLFFKTLLNSNSFKSTTPYLFERHQVFLKDIDRLCENSNTIKEKIEAYKFKVNETLNSDVFSFSEGYFETYEILVKEIFEFNQKYKSFKTQLYEFLIEII